MRSAQKGEDTLSSSSIGKSGHESGVLVCVYSYRVLASRESVRKGGGKTRNLSTYSVGRAENTFKVENVHNRQLSSHASSMIDSGCTLRRRSPLRSSEHQHSQPSRPSCRLPPSSPVTRRNKGQRKRRHQDNENDNSSKNPHQRARPKRRPEPHLQKYIQVMEGVVVVLFSFH